MFADATSTLRAALEVLRSEGLRSALNRVLDRGSEWSRSRRLLALGPGVGVLWPDEGALPVLNLSPVPPSPRRGGSHIQMLDRLECERAMRPIAFTYPRRDGTLATEVRTATRTGVFTTEPASGLGMAVFEAARRVGARIVHIENLHGLPFELIHDLENRGLTTVLSVHDFTLFCRRPHLIESTTGRFCDFSTDDNRCRACLRFGGVDPPPSQPAYRLAAAQSLRRASAVVYPSDYLRGRYHALFPEGPPHVREEVISPATAMPGAATAITTAASSPAVAFVGGCYEHKGGALIAPIMERIRSEIPGVSAFVYGNGDPELTRDVRRVRGVKVRGYYRQGSLPSLLARDRITVAVLPSIWPEAYGLVVDECLASEVPVVAFDLGAVGERLRAWGTGRLVPLEQGAHGLSRAILECVESPPRVTDAVIRRIPHPEDAARRHIALYQRMISA